MVSGVGPISSAEYDAARTHLALAGLSAIVETREATASRKRKDPLFGETQNVTISFDPLGDRVILSPCIRPVEEVDKETLANYGNEVLAEVGYQRSKPRDKFWYEFKKKEAKS